MKDNAHSPVISLGSDGVRVGAVVHITPVVPIRSNATQVMPVLSGSRMKKGRKQVVPDYVPASRQPRILRLAPTTYVGGGSAPDAPDVNIHELGQSEIQIGGNVSVNEPGIAISHPPVQEARLASSMTFMHVFHVINDL